jgi:hypothetical protein
MDAGKLTTAVHAVAGRALRTAEGSDDPGEVALARVLSRSGTQIADRLVVSPTHRPGAPVVRVALRASC